MTDGRDLKLVTIWSVAGMAASAVWIAALSAAPASGFGENPVERALHNLDQKECRRVLQGFATASGAGERVLWLWAEESAPMAFMSVSRTKRVESAVPPRPYAFRPDGYDVPKQACAFASNSVHVVSLDLRDRPSAFLISPSIE